MSTKVATKKETGVSMMMDDLFESAGQGMETMSSEDMQIPFLRICQALSPQLVKTDPKFIKGASAGDMFNNVTQQLWEGEEGLKIIPCAYEMKYLEFQLRESGGGFLGELDKNNPDIRQAQRTGSNEILPNGNELVRSAQYLVIAVDDDGVTQQMVLDSWFVHASHVGNRLAPDYGVGKQRPWYVVQLRYRAVRCRVRPPGCCLGSEGTVRAVPSW